MRGNLLTNFLLILIFFLGIVSEQNIIFMSKRSLQKSPNCNNATESSLSLKKKKMLCYWKDVQIIN